MIQIPASNPWVAVNRWRKVQRLCAALDSAFGVWKLDPFSAQALEAVLAMSDGAWTDAERNAGVPPASEHTRNGVIDVYAKRVEIRVSLSRLA